jgi:hypothetical protein
MFGAKQSVNRRSWLVITPSDVSGSSHENAASSQSKPMNYSWNGVCTIARMMGSHITAETFLNGTLAERKGRPEEPGSGRLTLHLESDIRAEARRLFYALTAPEYLETWISFPGQHLPGCSTVATKVNQDYMLAHLCEGIRKTVITGRYQVCERRNVVLSWRVEGAEAVAESYVDVRLAGNFEYTTLILRHRGFDSWQQYLWHRSLWSASLEKLSRLYDSLPYGIKSSRARMRLDSTAT